MTGLTTYVRNGGPPPVVPKRYTDSDWAARGIKLINGVFSKTDYPEMGVKWPALHSGQPVPPEHTHLGAHQRAPGAPLPFPPNPKNSVTDPFLNRYIETFSGPVTPIRPSPTPPGTKFLYYRYVGDGARPVSQFWTPTRYTDEAVMRSELALLHEWNGDREVEILETDVALDGYEGKAASQVVGDPSKGFYLAGGGIQYLIDPARIEQMIDAGQARLRLENL